MYSRACARARIAAILVAFAGAVSGQELEPRAYAPNPKGVTFVLFAYSKSAGDVLLDTSLPVTDVSADVNAGSLLVGRSFGLAGRSASFGLGLPYAWGSMEGNVGEEFRQITRSGLGDLRARLAVNLVGGPALDMREFAKRAPRTTLGASLVVAAPTGQYAQSKLINIGANRWAFKPELGLSHPHGRWFLELYAGAWLFTANDNFYGGQYRKQDPILSFQAHVAYTFKRRLWLSADATFYTGGQTTVNGIENKDRQEKLPFGPDPGAAHRRPAFRQVRLGPGHFHSHRRELQYLRRGLADPLASKAALIATAGPRNGLY